MWAGGRWLWQNQAEAGESCCRGTPSQMLQSLMLSLLVPCTPWKLINWVDESFGLGNLLDSAWQRETDGARAQLLSRAFAVSQRPDCHISFFCWANVRATWTLNVKECCWWEDREHGDTVRLLCESWCHPVHRSAEIRYSSCWLGHGKLFTYIKILHSVCDKRQPVILLHGLWPVHYVVTKISKYLLMLRALEFSLLPWLEMDIVQWASSPNARAISLPGVFLDSVEVLFLEWLKQFLALLLQTEYYFFRICWIIIKPIIAYDHNYRN